jgi:hypothetical protein
MAQKFTQSHGAIGGIDATGVYDPFHAPISGSASWPHGLLHHANIDTAQPSSTNNPIARGPYYQHLLCTGVSFPEQACGSNNIYHQPWSVSDTTPRALESSTLPSAFNLIQPVATSQPALSDPSALPLPLPEPIKPAEAVVLQLPDGKFFCSQLGCDAVYLRPGDCRRHLKMHNGPFFPCKQPGCDMEFYRRDKLRDHMKQGHNIVVAAPRRGRRVARLTANQGSGC